MPVLIDLNESILADSTAIVEYLEEAYPDRKLYPEILLARAEKRRIMAWFDTRFTQEVSLVILWGKAIKRMAAKALGQSSTGPDSNLIRNTKVIMANHLEYLA